MVKITKVYTRSGDKGMTQLAAGRPVAKTALRVEVCGQLDELNASLGWSMVVMAEDKKFNLLYQFCLQIQHELFDLGAQIAVLPEDRRNDTPAISSQDIQQLENEIDRFNSELPMLDSFILPGGDELAARLHLTRSICRRAERSLVHLSKSESLLGTEIAYLNRLSDWFFVAARWVCKKNNRDEILWQASLREK
jgi:cob(I)alamin adenosyltransferase